MVLRSTQNPRRKYQNLFYAVIPKKNSVLAHNKLSLLTAYEATHNFNMIYQSMVDYPENIKRDVVCLCCKEKFIVRLTDTTYIYQCILCKITIRNSRGYVTVIYRSPSQSNKELDLMNIE